MSITIYEKTPSGLYATGDRTVSTFPSGLVRVEQAFVCKTSAAATHRAALAVGTDMPGGSAPAIDGLKIFPEPQEKQRGDGFTEFIVSAYGRVRAYFYNFSEQTVKQRISNIGFVIKNGGRIDAIPVTADCTHLRVNGSLVVPKGSELTVEQLNIQLFGIKDIIHTINNPNKSLTPLYQLRTNQYQYIDWNGVTRYNQYIVYKYWESLLREPLDTSNAVEYYVKYDLPVISVNRRTEYGDFTEMDISVSGKVYAVSEQVDPNL